PQGRRRTKRMVAQDRRRQSLRSGSAQTPRDGSGAGERAGAAPRAARSRRHPGGGRTRGSLVCRADAAGGRGEGMSGDTLRVVIVDDEPLARTVVREYLKHHAGVEIVAECGNGFDAVKAVTELSPDLMFLDVQMQIG